MEIDANFRRKLVTGERRKHSKGAYHTFIGEKSGKEQAQNLIDIVKLEKGDLPPVLDIHANQVPAASPQVYQGLVLCSMNDE